MGKKLTAFANSKGNLFPAPDDATVSDMALLFDSIDLGRKVFEQRKEIERIFAEHDEMLQPAVPQAAGLT